MTWHVHEELLAEYERGRLDAARVMAVEAHLSRCASCRSTVPVDGAWLDESWSAVLDVVQAPRVGLAQRALRRIGLPEHRALLLAATPGLRRSWLAAMAAVSALAVSAAYVSRPGESAVLWFLALAPVLPVLAVATAYGAAVDPLHEITCTTPTAGPGLVLWRASAVVGVSLGIGVVAAALLPGRGWYAVAWLLPAFLLCVGSLALATAMALHLAAGLLGASWLAAVAAVTIWHAGVGVPVGATVQRQVFGPAAQAVYLVAVSGAAIVLIMRRGRLDPGGSR